MSKKLIKYIIKNKSINYIKKKSYKKKCSVTESIKIIKKNSKAKFNESIDLSINLDINPKNSNQNIQRSIILPYGTGKSLKIAVMACKKNQRIAIKSGADIVGLENLSKQIKSKLINFDILIAHTEIIQSVSKLGYVLGPKRMMPSTKLGTITNDIAQTVKNFKLGKIQYKNDKNGIIHITVGRISFCQNMIYSNIIFLLNDLLKIKNLNLNPYYIKKLTISSTMGLGIEIDISSFY